MAKSKSVIHIGLKCTESGHINYVTQKNRSRNQEKITLMKYCPVLHKHTMHREVKLK